MPALHTDRLLLRPWRPSDHEPFAKLNADTVVMRHFPAPLARGESDAMADRIRTLMDERGWGLWAVEVPGVAPFVGFVGLHVPSAELPFFPCVEIGWRLDRAHWGNGYASEAAQRALRFGFTRLMLDEIVSFTAVSNAPSLAVMARLGMRGPGEPFEHPALPKGSPLRPHILHRLSRRDWLRRHPDARGGD
jgi:RimJ/RimL family protein N-acetyltransferase